MSIPLDAIDLSSVAVGSTGTLDWTGKIGAVGPVGVHSKSPHLRLFNESGAGIRIDFNFAGGDRIPAGGWALYELKGGQNSLRWTVEYVLPGAPVSLLLATLYEPGEAVPDTPTLGNSPIGIGGTVPVTGVDAVINDGNAAGATVVEATQSGQASSSVKFMNDATALLAAISLGTLTTLFQLTPGSAGAKAALVIGSAADPTLTTLHGVADRVPADGVQAGSLPAGVTIGAGQVAAGAFGGSAAASFPSDLTVPTTLTVSGTTGLVLRNNSGAGIHLMRIFSGTGTGTFTTGASASPTSVQATCSQLNSTQTMGYDTPGLSVHINTGASLSWSAVAFA